MVRFSISLVSAGSQFDQLTTGVVVEGVPALATHVTVAVPLSLKVAEAGKGPVSVVVAWLGLFTQGSGVTAVVVSEVTTPSVVTFFVVYQ